MQHVHHVIGNFVPIFYINILPNIHLLSINLFQGHRTLFSKIQGGAILKNVLLLSSFWSLTVQFTFVTCKRVLNIIL